MGTTTATDRIEKTVIIKAPRSRVWRAIADARQFGEWFRVNLDGDFKAGATIFGKITYPGYEHLTMEMAVDRIEPERLFSYRWHPAGVDPKADYSAEPMTLVEFILEDVSGGTRLTIVESGFDGSRWPGGPKRSGSTRAAGPSRCRTSSAMSTSRSAAAARLHDSAPIFAALGDETRLAVVARLCAKGRSSITRLSEGAGVTRQAITKHLNALSSAGLARNVRQWTRADLGARDAPARDGASLPRPHLGSVGCRARRLKAFVLKRCLVIRGARGRPSREGELRILFEATRTLQQALTRRRRSKRSEPRVLRATRSKTDSPAQDVRKDLKRTLRLPKPHELSRHVEHRLGILEVPGRRIPVAATLSACRPWSRNRSEPTKFSSNSGRLTRSISRRSLSASSVRPIDDRTMASKIETSALLERACRITEKKVSCGARWSRLLGRDAGPVRARPPTPTADHGPDTRERDRPIARVPVVGRRRGEQPHQAVPRPPHVGLELRVRAVDRRRAAGSAPARAADGFSAAHVLVGVIAAPTCRDAVAASETRPGRRILRILLDATEIEVARQCRRLG